MEDGHTAVAVDRETCGVCGACAAACPMEALLVEGLTLVVMAERCRPCGQAALVCPTGALKCPDNKRNREKPVRGDPQSGGAPDWKG